MVFREKKIFFLQSWTKHSSSHKCWKSNIALEFCYLEARPYWFWIRETFGMWLTGMHALYWEEKRRNENWENRAHSSVKWCKTVLPDWMESKKFLQWFIGWWDSLDWHNMKIASPSLSLDWLFKTNVSPLFTEV